MDKMVKRPTTYKVFKWDGDDSSDFKENLPDNAKVTKDGDSLLVIQDKDTVVEVKKDHYLVLSEKDDAIHRAHTMDEDELKDSYQKQ